MRFLLAVALLVSVARADEAVLRDGQHVEGSLSFTADRKPQFVPAGKTEPLARESIHHIRFPDGDSPPLRASLVQRISLRDGSVLSGVVLGLDAKQLEMRTAWAEKLVIPRPAVASIRAVFRDDVDPKRPAGDPMQDEIWLKEGDQVFGRVVGGDSRAVRLEDRFGKHSFPWADVRGLFLNGDTPAARRDERVRLWLDGGAGGEPDVLEGAVVAWQEKHVRLRHPDLGEVEIERRRLNRLFWAAKE